MKFNSINYEKGAVMSLPVRECGLKSLEFSEAWWTRSVTPCAGVWIEIFQEINIMRFNMVTPCAGVWIEIE